MDVIVQLLIGLGPFGILLAILILKPESIEVFSSMVWRFLKRLGNFAQKRYVKHDLQGRVRRFVKALQKNAPQLETGNFNIEWVHGGVDKKSFIEKGSVVLRLRANDPQDLNFVHGAFLFVSTSLLFKSKKYLSEPQKNAIDLYVTSDLLEKEKPSVRSYFLDNYLYPGIGTKETKVSILFDKFYRIAEAGFFYPVFIQKLDILGEKVFGGKKDSRIAGDVNNLCEFLFSVATREVGSEMDLNFEEAYCKIGIVIVGKRFKLEESINPYIKWINKIVHEDGLENIYLIARLENKKYLNKIVKAVESDLDLVSTRRSNGLLQYSSGQIKREQYIVALRKKGVGLYQPSPILK